MATNNDADALPLSGVVICCTSLTQDVRTRVSDIAKQLGAVHKLDLTSDVTHLLVGDINTPKYKFVAKERPDVKVLHPDFIDRVNALWRDAEDITPEIIQTLEKEFKIPTFASLRICITGFEDPDHRRAIEREVESLGGKYNPDLVKTVTHLVALKPEGAKYTHAKQWGIKVVGLKWLEDSMIRGMAVDESFYPPEMPREQQGIGAFRMVPRQPNIAPGKRAREDDTTPAEPGPRKKLRKSASMRLGGQSQDMWQNFSQHEVEIETSMVDAWQDAREDESQTMRDSLAPRKSEVTETVERLDPVEPQGLFAGYYVLIHGFDVPKTKQIRKAIEKDGAVVVRTANELEAASENIFFKSRYLIMPHAQPTTLPDVPHGTILVTEWWLERCLFFKQNLNPDDDALSQPLAGALIPAFNKLKISMTGFNQVDCRMTAETVKLMGAEYQEQLLPSTSILVCASNDVKREKALYASKHNIPVVSPAWLWESLRSRDKVSLETYRFKLPIYDQSLLAPEGSHSSPAVSARAPVRGSRDQDKRAEDPMHPKRLSNTRRRHATPSLMLKAGSASRPSEPAPQKPRPGPFIHEDDDEDQNESPEITLNADHASQHLTTSHTTTAKHAGPPALREISLNTSQSRTASQQQPRDKPRHDDPDTAQPLADKAAPISHEDDISHEPEPRPKSPGPENCDPNSAKENAGTAPKVMSDRQLTSDMASILNRLVASGQDSASHAHLPEKRKHRPLGRNLSGTSLTNIAGKHTASPAMSGLSEEGEVLYSEADGFAPAKQEVALPPGTQLGYGGDGETSSRRTVSVRDSEEVAMKKEAMGAAAAAGGRKATRARTKT